jgi:hypothetical protein
MDVKQSLTLREEHKLTVYENRVLKRIFSCSREEVVGSWTRLHNKELHNLYTSQNIISLIKLRRMRRVGHVAHMGEMRNAYRILVRKPEGKRPFRRPRCGWKHNIRRDVREIALQSVDWTHLMQIRDQ